MACERRLRPERWSVRSRRWRSALVALSEGEVAPGCQLWAGFTSHSDDYPAQNVEPRDEPNEKHGMRARAGLTHPA